MRIFMKKIVVALLLLTKPFLLLASPGEFSGEFDDWALPVVSSQKVENPQFREVRKQISVTKREVPVHKPTTPTEVKQQQTDQPSFIEMTVSLSNEPPFKATMQAEKKEPVKKLKNIGYRELYENFEHYKQSNYSTDTLLNKKALLITAEYNIKELQAEADAKTWEEGILLPGVVTAASALGCVVSSYLFYWGITKEKLSDIDREIPIAAFGILGTFVSGFVGWSFGEATVQRYRYGKIFAAQKARHEEIRAWLNEQK